MYDAVSAMKFLYSIIGAGLFLAVVEAGSSVGLCNSPMVVENFDQEACLGIWYHYGGSTPCYYCCIIRELALIAPGLINATDTYHIHGLPQPIVNNYLGRRIGKTLAYYCGSDPRPMMIIDGDCRTYTTMKRYNDDKVEVFTRQVKPLLVPEIPECNIKIYNYRADKACLPYI